MPSRTRSLRFESEEMASGQGSRRTPGATSKPVVPCSICSGIPPTEEAMTGVARACASTTAALWGALVQGRRAAADSATVATSSAGPRKPGPYRPVLPRGRRCRPALRANLARRVRLSAAQRLSTLCKCGAGSRSSAPQARRSIQDCRGRRFPKSSRPWQGRGRTAMSPRPLWRDTSSATKWEWAIAGLASAPGPQMTAWRLENGA